MLSAERLLEEGREAAGLGDYGDMGFAEGLGVLVKSVNEEARLDVAREGTLRTHIVRVLVNRLRMQRDIAVHPEIVEEELLPPVFITSLPRTGSTKLHRLLAATGDFNGLPFWMSYNFAPFHDGDPALRLAAAEEYIAWERATSPLFHSAHPHYADEFEEELQLLDAGFNSLYSWAAFLDVPSYVQWVLGGDHLQAFRDLTALLKYIQWQHYRGLNRRWVLKTPSFFGFEGAYGAVLPGTDFIVTHRDPVQIWPSLCTLFRGVRGLYYDEDYTSVANDFMLGTFGQAQLAHLAWRDAYPAEKVLDVRFAEVMDDEAALLRRIYDWLGMEFTEASQRNLDAWLEMDAARGHVRTPGTLEEYGVTTAAVNTAMAPYIARYADQLKEIERT